MLNNIGFYTLLDERARTSSASSSLSRCELILTGRCNFRCPYCRSVGGRDISIRRATETVRLWCAEGLRNIRFSGGEPTLYMGLPELVSLAKSGGVKRIALSTNGSADIGLYRDLVHRGVNDFSVSLDACCSEDGDKMAGGIRGSFERVENTIRELSRMTYTTVGIVLTEDNQRWAEEIIYFANALGVHDIRVIPAAQRGTKLPKISVDEALLEKYPILKYRVEKLVNGGQVRGLSGAGPRRCGLVLDDMAVMGHWHYPCIIYLREGGEAIGKVGPTMREERELWFLLHDCILDTICSRNCLDVCVDYNAQWEMFHAA
jgi:MoaA/NifB/PqqE/SkfB family radical SAM enzyme